MKFGMKVQTSDSLPKPNFIFKNRLRGILIFVKFFLPKITNFGDFGGCNPHFKSDND